MLYNTKKGDRETLQYVRVNIVVFFYIFGYWPAYENIIQPIHLMLIIIVHTIL